MSEIDQRQAALRDSFSRMAPVLIGEDMSEADIRAKLIDPLFRTALAWPEALIRREARTDADGLIDYTFGFPERLFLAEAKRASVSFTFPVNSIGKTHTISTLCAADKNLKSALIQAARYCQDEGTIPFAVVCNGQQLAVFRAIRTDQSWLKGQALVFGSPQEIVERFGQLWDLLSFPAVVKSSLPTFFSLPETPPRDFKSIISTLPNADETLIRNPLHQVLIPITRGVFDELTDQQQSEVLERCYVYSQQLRSVADDFILAVRDLPPAYLRGAVKEVRTDRRTGTGGLFQESLQEIIAANKRGTVLLLLGGVGAGKSTFLRQVRAKFLASAINQSGSYFYLDFRDAPPTPPFEGFVFQSLRRQLNADAGFRTLLEADGHPSSSQPLEDPTVLQRLFAVELDKEASLSNALGISDVEYISRKKLETLKGLIGSDRTVVARAFRAIQSGGRFLLLVLDNADQLELQYQLQIFLFAENLAAETGANVIVALREEKYYLASQQGAFNAFQTQAFHIPSPRLSDLLSLRLSYATANLEKLLPGDSEHHLRDARDFLETIRLGGVGAFGRAGSSNVVRLLERLSMGNMRMALTMFRSFVQSGNTQVSLILEISRRKSRSRVIYYIPFHEFTKSVMLGDHRYYRESHSVVLNLFGISGVGPSSHLTASRILAYLLHASERTSAVFERGFVPVDEVLQRFQSVFYDTEDARSQLQRLLKASAIESDTGVTSDLDRCRALRATAAGEYYLTFLARAFAYLDLVWVDTPLCDLGCFTRLRQLLDHKDKDSRFERVDLFLRYLEEEERREVKAFTSMRGIEAWSYSLVGRMKKQIDVEKAHIARKFSR